MHRGIVLAIVFLSILASVHAILPNDPGFRGCVIVTDKGSLQDVDCDKVPDPFDNCPFTANPDQVDRDHNGIGDACDLVIDDVKIDPSTPMQGRSLVATVYITNNRAYPMRNIEVKLEAPKLGVAANDQISLLNPGERTSRELIVRVPDCAATAPADLAVIAEYPFAPGQKETFSQTLKVPVVSSGSCSTEPGNDQTVVNIIELQDVDPVNGAIYPFTIHNNQADSKAYVLSVKGAEDWGYAEVNPGSLIVIPAGQSRDGAIQVWANPGVSGKKSFTFTVQAKDDAKQIVLLANIPEATTSSTSTPQLLTGLIGFLVVLVIVAGIALLMKKRKHK